MMRLKLYLSSKKARNTQLYSKISIKQFLVLIYGLENPSEDDLDRYADQYIQSVKNGDRVAIQDILIFAAALSDKSPSTQTNRVYQIKVWLEFYEIEFTSSQVRKIRNACQGKQPQVEDRLIRQQDIKKILHFSNPMLRTVVLLLNSTGCRPGEILELTKDMLDLNNDPPRIDLPRSVTKTNTKRTVFLNREAKEALEMWLKYRTTYINKVRNYSEERKADRINDKRLFPFDYHTVNDQFIAAQQKAGIEEFDTNTQVRRRKIHLHSFRQRLRTELSKGEGEANPIDATERIMGHAGYLGGRYSKIDVDELADFYKRNQHLLLVNTPVEVSTEELREIRLENAQLKGEIESLSQKMKMTEATLFHWQVALPTMLAKFSEDDPERLAKVLQDIAPKV